MRVLTGRFVAGRLSTLYTNGELAILVAGTTMAVDTLCTNTIVFLVLFKVTTRDHP